MIFSRKMLRKLTFVVVLIRLCLVGSAHIRLYSGTILRHADRLAIASCSDNTSVVDQIDGERNCSPAQIVFPSWADGKNACRVKATRVCSVQPQAVVSPDYHMT